MATFETDSLKLECGVVPLTRLGMRRTYFVPFHVPRPLPLNFGEHDPEMADRR